MKTLKTKFFAFAFLALGFSALVTSCGKDGDGTKEYASDLVPGTYIGVHKLNIPPGILTVLSENLPVDPETGEKPDLNEGFVDTLIVSVDGSTIIVESLLLDQTVNGRLTADNQVKIDEKKFAVLNLGTSVTAENASVSTAKDVKFNAGSTPTKVELRLKASKIADLELELDINTNGTFVRQ